MRVYRLSQNVMKYSFGNPISTEAVVMDGHEISKDNLDYFRIDAINGLKFTYKMSSDAIVWGLGENQRGLNKRGGIYEAFCSDDPKHTPDKKSLYGAHNFLVVDGKEKFGVFVDYPGRVIFDVGFSHKDYLEVSVEEENVDIYIITGDKTLQIVREFLNIIGEGYAPPKWAFGYQQSRWSYPDAESVRDVGDRFRENDIPCDAIYLDIDYMERFKDFTVDNKTFPEFEKFVQEMKGKGFKLIPIIDAGVKIEEGYDVYEEGVQNDYFCTDVHGKSFVAAVWPGRCHFPDFLNPKARQWFGLKYKTLTDAGIEGFWNDMNEPAIFYTDRGLKEAIEVAKVSENQNLDIYSYFGLNDKFNTMANNLQDYNSFYHNMNGDKINHYKVHNLYGYNMTRAAGEGLSEIAPNKRFLLFSRASYIGMHRYSGLWTGDNHSWWDHILLNIKMMPSLNMCGFLYIGADTGGFSGNANSQLVIRWTQFSLFTPLFRNHSAMGTRAQEPYSFEKETVDILRRSIELRYALIPYIYSEYMKALKNKDMYFKPLSFEYNDEMCRKIENQLLIGDSLMVTPIYEENSVGRYAYLPENMVLWKAVNYENRTFEVMKSGHHYMNVGFNEVPIFIRENKMLVLGKHSNSVETLNND
ncbi:TIM-barrel domain-containing protein, partial [Clostridium sp.]|uniref:glycoside hydrolase family 31 protein n=1 Tax=Clostridium sp. TaxID=1506 RepID=UPI002FC94B8F